jgi:hypothetical protein
MDYLKLLEESFEIEGGSRLEFLSDYIFDFTTYDSEIATFFVGKALEICGAITKKETFEYIKNEENYKWYIAMCNMPFFVLKLEWGTSVRGAWWNIYGDDIFEIQSCGLWKGNKQLLSLKLNEQNWLLFLEALAVFAKAELDS